MSNDIFKIIIQDFKVRAIIGILNHERNHEQEIVVNATLDYNYKDGFLDYIQVINFIASTLKEQKYFLLEEAILDINTKLRLAFCCICSVSITLKKTEILDSCVVGIRGDFKA